jgi:hypothetical protein
MEFDFIDIGCSKGGSLAWGMAQFGGTGLGIDLSERKVLATRAAGYQAIVADATALDMADDAVRFATLSDVLEHMPDGETAERCLAEAYRVSRDFVLVRGPNFDREEDLAKLSLKRYYADWRGHTWHHQSEDLVRLARRVGAARTIIVSHARIRGSEDPDILPAGAPRDQGRYDATLHGTKPLIAFRRKLYSRIMMVLGKSSGVNLDAVALKAVSERAMDFTPAEGPAAPDAYSGPRSTVRPRQSVPGASSDQTNRLVG